MSAMLHKKECPRRICFTARKLTDKPLHITTSLWGSDGQASSALAQSELLREALQLAENLGELCRKALLNLLSGGIPALKGFILLLRYCKVLRIAIF